jgi:hypothetical protein
MTILTINRAAHFAYDTGYQTPVTPPDYIQFGNLDADTPWEQCCMEFNIDPALINSTFDVWLEFELNGTCFAGTKYVRRWKNAFPIDYPTVTSSTALDSSTNQASFIHTSGTVRVNIKNLIADMVTAGQTKVLVGIPEHATETLPGGSIKYASPYLPYIEYTLASSGRIGTATLNVLAITVDIEGRHTTKGTLTRTLDVITLDSEGREIQPNRAVLNLDPVTLLSEAVSFVKGIYNPTITVELVTAGTVEVKGVLTTLSPVVISMTGNNYSNEGILDLTLDDIIVSGEIPQGGRPRVGTASPVITISLSSQGRRVRSGELTEGLILITLYARILPDPPAEADSPFMDSHIPIFVGTKNATFRSMS